MKTSIYEMWDEFIFAAPVENFSRAELKTLRYAFFSGVNATLRMLTAISNDDNMDNDECDRVLMVMMDELTTYSATVEAEASQNAGNLLS